MHIIYCKVPIALLFIRLSRETIQNNLLHVMEYISVTMSVVSLSLLKLYLNILLFYTIGIVLNEHIWNERGKCFENSICTKWKWL